MLNLNLDSLNRTFEGQAPHEIITWSLVSFGTGVAMSSSFQTQSVPLLHIVSQVAPQLPVIFLETGYHFPETLAFRDQLIAELGLNVKIFQSTLPQAAFAQQYGESLYQRDPDLCCYLNKVEPLQRAMEGLDAWISGIRRDQLSSRANAQILEATPQGMIRVHPMATWTNADINQYIKTHNLPQHPLMSQGYCSIGCAPCTSPVLPNSDERDGRWAGQGKTECGLHTLLRQPENGSPHPDYLMPLINIEQENSGLD